LRINLAGAGTGLPGYARRYGGAVINLTIDRFAYAMVSQTGRSAAQVVSSDYARLLDEDAPHEDSFRRPAEALLREFGIDQGLSVFLTAELPPFSGVGAVNGSALALVWALAAVQGKDITPVEAARLAVATEANPFAMPCGGADLYGQALGGLTAAEVTEHGVCANAVALADEQLEALEEHLMLFFTGRLQRDLTAVEEVDRAAERNRAGVIEALHEIKAAAVDLRAQLHRGEIDGIGQCLDRTWRATRRLGPSMTDAWVDQWYAMASNAGASGGKINGFGASGFLVLYCEPDRQQKVTDTLESAGLRPIDVRLESTGVDLLLDESKFLTASKQGRSTAGNHARN
jgi:galactokinase/mevalonate kinase-like predicted kinase